VPKGTSPAGVIGTLDSSKIFHFFKLGAQSDKFLRSRPKIFVLMVDKGKGALKALSFYREWVQALVGTFLFDKGPGNERNTAVAFYRQLDGFRIVAYPADTYRNIMFFL